MSRSVDLSLECGRKYQSSVTGLIHYCFENFEKHAETIPFLENAYFVLSLFRTRLVDPIQEAKALLQRLLAFQVNGNFPVYLHEYPECKNHYLCFHLLPIFYMIRKEYGNVLGEEIRSSLQKAIDAILLYGERIEKEKTLSFGAKVKLEGARGNLQNKTPSSVYEWGDYLIAAQMTDQFDEVWKNACAIWNPVLGAYIGKEGSPKQEKKFPSLSVYDFFMAESTQKYPARLSSQFIHTLHSAIVTSQPFIEGNVFSSFVCRDLSFQKSYEILWEDEGNLQSLVCESGKCSMDVQNRDGCLQFTFVFPNSPAEEGESEIIFYLTAHLGNAVLVEGNKATLFRMDDKLLIGSPQKNIPLRFSSKNTGRFTGHISYGNRSYQTACHGAYRFDAYDFKITLRTVNRALDHVVIAEIILPEFQPIS